MPAILTLNKINTSLLVQVYLGATILLSGAVLVSKFVSGVPMSEWHFIRVPLVQLIPNKTLYHPWTLLTSTFVETNIFKFLISTISFYYGLDFLSRNWDSSSFFSMQLQHELYRNEVTRFLLFVSVTTNIVTVLNYIVFAILIFHDKAVLQSPIDHGLLSLLMPFLVVLKQLKPELEVKYTSIRLKHLPFIVYIASILLSLITRSLTPFLPISNSWLVSWYYLRFIQQADLSPTFEFLSFFPDLLKPALAPVFNALGLVLKILNLVPETSSLSNSILPTSHTSDVLERRRQVALKVLEERIGE